MKKNERTESLLSIIKCKYLHLVLACQNIVLSDHFYQYLERIKDISYPFILKGNIKDVGTKFMISRPDLKMNIFYEIIEIIITDYYTRFRYNIYKTIPESFQYVQQVEIRYLNEDECELRSSFIYDNQNFISEKEIIAVIHFKKSIFNCIEYFLSTYSVQKISTSYTIINAKIELIRDIIRNMKMIHKYVHLLSEKLSYTGELLKKDIIIELINTKKNKKIKWKAKIENCKMITTDLTKEYIIELLFQNNENNKSPFTEIKIIINEFNGKCTMYILYYFSNIQSYITLENFTKYKNRRLNKLKNIIENYNQNVNCLDYKNNYI